MKKRFFISSALVFQLLCVVSTARASDFEGTLTVKEPITLKGSLWRKTTLQTGNYTVGVDVHNMLKRVTLDLAGHSYRFHFPGGMLIPMLDGQVNLLAGSNGQDLNMQWNARTDVKIGPRFSQRESCIYDTYYTTDCYWNPVLHRRVCDQVPHNVYGTQDVTRHNEISEHFFKIYFTNTAGVNTATLNATTADTRTFMDFQGVCLR